MIQTRYRGAIAGGVDQLASLKSTQGSSGAPGDRAVLNTLDQQRSLILNSAGRRSIFNTENDFRVTPKNEYEYNNSNNRLTY